MEKIKNILRFTLGCIAMPFLILSVISLLLSAVARVITVCIIGEFGWIKEEFKDTLSPYFF